MALLMEGIFFLKDNDCYILPDTRCLSLQQIAFMYKFKREIYVDSRSLLFQQAFSHSVCLKMSPQDSADTQNILKPYEQNVYFPLANKTQ